MRFALRVKKVRSRVSMFAYHAPCRRGILHRRKMASRGTPEVGLVIVSESEEVEVVRSEALVVVEGEKTERDRLEVRGGGGGRRGDLENSGE